jgi:hypothetical protein
MIAERPTNKLPERKTFGLFFFSGCWNILSVGAYHASSAWCH